MKSVKANVSFPKMEEDLLDVWKKDRTFYKSNDKRKEQGNKEFTFYDGPPFANGLPHYGHLLANTIKDTVPRYWNMNGYYVERRFGWDTHGVPVEYEIEKREGIKGQEDLLKVGVDKFNEMCRESVLTYAEKWKHTVTRLGRWVDWDNQYRTMDLSFMESVWWVFSSLHEKGLIYQGHKVVPYSPRISTVLSNFEANQNYQDVQDPAVTVKFKVADEESYILAWTTTPWTLTSNLALAVGEDIDYVKVRHLESGEFYYLAKELVDAVFKKGKKDKEPKYEVVENLKGRDLLNKKYEPLFPFFKDHPNSFVVISSGHVTTESGTGIVHMAPAFGEDDFNACNKLGIKLIDPLDDEGKFNETVATYAGMYFKEADKQIIKDLKDSNNLLKHETFVHSYPMCDRTNEPLIYRAIPSWYVAVEKIKDMLIENNKTINWVPGHLKAGRMGKWLENARDWAISRNRYWGTPLPIWVCEHDKKHIKVVGSVSELEKLSGQSDIKDIHKHKIDHLSFECPECSGRMKRIPEVFDCWFESGSMPYAQKHYPFENSDTFGENFPADFIAEGLDQTRGWFYTLQILSGALFGKPAFKNVVVNGLVLAEDGRKMSKRWKNYTAPEILIGQYGADSVRLYMLNSAILRGEDLKFSDEGVKDTTRAVLLPYWNALSFLSTYAEADGWKPNSDLVNGIAPKVDGELDKWIISRLNTLVKNVHNEMKSYHLYNVVPQVLGFIEDLTNWYIRQSRRRFWAGAESMSDETRQGYETLYFVLVEFSKVFAPFAPFTADNVYRVLTDGMDNVESSVHLCDMPSTDESSIDVSLEEQMSLVRRVTELGRSLRAKHQIKTRQVLPELLVISSKEEDQAYIENSVSIVVNELNVKKVSFSSEEAKFVNLSLKPNLRTLGRKLGKQLNDFRSYLAELNKNPNDAANFLADLADKGSFEWDSKTFEETDLLIDRSSKGERLIATDKGMTVLLDTTLTPELIQEGLARETINRIQNLRKDTGLDVTDRITCKVFADDQLSSAIRSFEDYISSEVQADKIIFVDDSDILTEFDLGDAKMLKVAVEKV